MELCSEPSIRTLLVLLEELESSSRLWSSLEDVLTFFVAIFACSLSTNRYSRSTFTRVHKTRNYFAYALELVALNRRLWYGYVGGDRATQSNDANSFRLFPLVPHNFAGVFLNSRYCVLDTPESSLDGLVIPFQFAQPLFQVHARSSQFVLISLNCIEAGIN